MMDLSSSRMKFLLFDDKAFMVNSESEQMILWQTYGWPYARQRKV